MNQENNSTDLKHLLFADKIAALSKDPSTKVGAIFRSKEHPESYICGYNGMPRGLDDSHPERNERPEKYNWYEHAERNGLYNKAREIVGGHIMFSSVFPDMEAARAVTSSGIGILVVNKLSRDNLSDEELKMVERVYMLLTETKVKIIELDNATTRLEKKYAQYLDLAHSYGELFSKDPDNKAGVMIVNKKSFAHITSGANSPPPRLNYLSEEQLKSDEMKSWTIGAIKNSIFNVVRPFFKENDVSVSWCPCEQCALAMVAVEVGSIETRAFDFTKEADLRWKDSFIRTEKLLKAASIPLKLLNMPLVEVVNKKPGLK